MPLFGRRDPREDLAVLPGMTPEQGPAEGPQQPRMAPGVTGLPADAAPRQQPTPAVPGVTMRTAIPPQVELELLTRPAGQQVIGKKEIQAAAEILTRYKDGKTNLERRIVEDELWWELRHQEILRRKSDERDPKLKTPAPTSAWLFNAIANKHADAMDNYPEPVVLPREQSDEGAAKVLSSVLPVLMEYNDFEATYSTQWWEKLKHGTAAYGVFWNSEKENGLGDVDIRGIDLLKLFWEPGVTDIQKSRNLFIVELVDTDLLDQQYPDHAGRMNGGTIDVKTYLYDDTVDTSDKSVVVDWYYKTRTAAGTTVLQYVKFCCDELLYASENDPEYRERGFYDHGMYPVVLDTLYPEKGTPVGFGYVSVCKDPQLYIDKLSGNILEASMMATKRRYFASDSANINEDEFLDWNKPIIHVNGAIDDTRIKELQPRRLDSIYYQVMQGKIDEMKDTASNRDINSGGAGAGVTAAAAIAALQEAGNKVSRDMIAASYRAHEAISRLCLELIRQFYDEARAFRITGDDGRYKFVDMSNQGLRDQPMGFDQATGAELYRRPVFDLRAKAQKSNPFSQMANNEYAKELYQLGFFNPDRAQEALGALEMMEFEGADKVRSQVQQGQTLMNICQQQQAQIQQLAALLAAATGAAVGGQAPPAQSGGGEAPSAAPASGNRGEPGHEVLGVSQSMTGYGQRLAKRSTPSVDGT